VPAAALARHGRAQERDRLQALRHVPLGLQTVSRRVPPCALAAESSSVPQCSPRKAHLRDEDAQQRCPQENSRPDRERANGLTTAEDAV